MKIFGLLYFLFVSSFIVAQDKMITKTGTVVFEASVPSFEEVKAKNENVSCILNIKTGEIASLALMKGFRFKIALMEEHFNENYIESDKYPRATFRGVIKNFDFSTINETVQEYTIKGKLELRGKSKEIELQAKIKNTTDGLRLLSVFEVNVDDFNINIPSIVSKKVSKKVLISLDFLLK